MAYGKSFVAEALRSQATAEEKQKSLSKMFAADTASRLSQIVAQQMQRGGARRGKEAASRGAGASAMDQIEFGKSRLELEKDISQQAQISNWISTASSAVGSIIAFSATQADDAAKKEAEAAAVEEAKNTEKAAMLTDMRKPGEEYSPSMLRVPDDPLVEELIRDEFDPQTTDGYFPRGGQVPQGYRGTGLGPTEYKAERDAYRAEKATESLLDELVEDEAQESALLKMKELTNKYQRGQVRESLSPGYKPPPDIASTFVMTDDELAKYLFEGGM